MEQKPKPEASLTIQGLQIEDYRRVVLADLTPSRTGLVLIRGRNEHGKTSLIDAALETLGVGRAAMPIRQGAHTSTTLLDLGDVVVRGHWTKGSDGKAKRSLSVESPPGEQLDRPAEVLKKLRGHMADPSIFTDMKSEDQAKTILRVLGVEGELERLGRVVNKHFDERTRIGREKDATQKTYQRLYTELEGVPEREAGVSIEELAAALESAQTSNNLRMNQEVRKETATNLAARDGGRMVAIDEETKRLEGEIERLVQERCDLEAATEEHRGNWRNAEYYLQGNALIDLAPLRESLSDGEAAAQAVGRRELLLSAESDAQAAATAHEEVEAAVIAARDAVSHFLAAVEFPVEGMTYDADTKAILVNGLPSEQWSQAQRIRIAATVAMSGSPRLKVIFAREGSLIDAAGQALLHEIAVEKGFQVLLEVVDSTREGEGIWIEDGIATQEFAPSANDNERLSERLMNDSADSGSIMSNASKAANAAFKKKLAAKKKVVRKKPSK